MDQATYNARVQEMQAMWPDDGHRVRAVVADGRNPAFREGELLSANFEVYWDGHWHLVGREDFPMSSRVSRFWNEDEAIKLMARFAHALVNT